MRVLLTRLYSERAFDSIMIILSRLTRLAGPHMSQNGLQVSSLNRAAELPESVFQWQGVRPSCCSTQWALPLRLTLRR